MTAPSQPREHGQPFARQGRPSGGRRKPAPESAASPASAHKAGGGVARWPAPGSGPRAATPGPIPPGLLAVLLALAFLLVPLLFVR